MLGAAVGTTIAVLGVAAAVVCTVFTWRVKTHSQYP